MTSADFTGIVDPFFRKQPNPEPKTDQPILPMADLDDIRDGDNFGLNKPADPEHARRNVETAIEKKLFDSLGRTDIDWLQAGR